MKCVICGKEDEHIQNIKKRKENITNELSRIGSSDPELSQKLLQKLSKYDAEISHLESISTGGLCPKCEEMLDEIIEDKLIDVKDEIIEELVAKLSGDNDDEDDE
jgi:transcription initiation factor IIE alpha subunit